MAFVYVPPKPKRPPVVWQVLTTLATGLILFLLGAGLITGGYQMLFSERIFPGISMAGVDLSSLTPEQASAALDQRLTYPTDGRIVFRDGNKVWIATPAELGIVFDAGASLQRAYGLGRQGGWLARLAGQLNAWQGGLDLAPVILFDERVAHGYLLNIAAQIDQPVIEADLHLDDTQVVYTPGQAGRILNVDDTLSALKAQFEFFQDGQISLVITEQAPTVLDASAQAESLRQGLSAPLTLTIANAQAGDPGPWTIDPSLLAGMLSVGRVQTDAGWQYQVTLDTTALDQFLGQVAPQVDRQSQNARFYFDDASGQLVLWQSATVGRTLDIDATGAAVTQALIKGEHTVPLVLVVNQPEVTDDATASSLGITGLVTNGSYTSYFRGSSTERMQNIQAAASRFYGLLVPPNATFSMADALGDISLENGYAEGLIIYNGLTITGVGGGVCQVSTTLFRTAFYAGYPIVERHEHAYRVYYYEQTATGIDPGLAGLDATVYVPLVDLKFTNDRSDWLLMETYFDPDQQKLIWKFYSGDDDRSVDVQNLGLTNIVPAGDPKFEENPGLGSDEISSADWWSTDGADVVVTRAVSRGGQILFSDAIRTHYESHPAVCQYGPGTNDPEALAAQLGLCQH